MNFFEKLDGIRAWSLILRNAQTRDRFDAVNTALYSAGPLRVCGISGTSFIHDYLLEISNQVSMLGTFHIGKLG